MHDGHVDLVGGMGVREASERDGQRHQEVGVGRDRDLHRRSATGRLPHVDPITIDRARRPSSARSTDAEARKTEL
jgi:hypothetical protein